MVKTFRRHLRGSEREQFVAALAVEYMAGATVRGLAEKHDRSYGAIWRMLVKDAGVQMRPRGGWHRRRSV